MIMAIRIVKLEYNDGTAEYQIRIENCRGYVIGNDKKIYNY